MKYVSFFFILFMLFSCKKEQETFNGNEISLLAANTAPYKGVVVVSDADLLGLIYVDAKSNIYALEVSSNMYHFPELHKYSSNKYLGVGDYFYEGLQGVFVDKNDVLYITTFFDIQNWSGLVFDFYGFGRASNSKTDSLGNFYIAFDGAVIKWMMCSNKTMIVAGGNGLGSADNQLGEIEAVDFDVNGAVYTAERGSQRIRKWESGVPTSITIVPGNQMPNSCIPGVAVDENSNVYVIDRNKRIIKYTPGATKGQMIIDEKTPGASKNFNPVYLFCDKRGNLYISDVANRQITKWSL